MDDSVHLFCVCIGLCIGIGLAIGRAPVQGVLPTVYRIKKLKIQERAIEPWMDERMDGQTDRQRERVSLLKSSKSSVIIKVVK
jgi:hypothetical protein